MKPRLADSRQGCGSTTRCRDCSTNILAFTWSRVSPSLPPVYNLAKHKLCASPITRNVGPRSWFEYVLLLSAYTAPFISCSIAWNWSTHWHWWLLCKAACTASRDIDCQVTGWKFYCPFYPYSVFLTQGIHWETNVSAGRLVLHQCTSNLSSGTALQQDFVISKVGSKHLMMNIFAAVHSA